MKPRSLPEILSLNTYWIGHAFLWNSLHILLLPAILLNYVPESQKNSYLGLLTFFGLLMAMVIQPVSGALSDRWVSRWGRRRPLMMLGVGPMFACLALLAAADSFLALAVAYLGLQLSSNIVQGPAQGLLPDRVPPEHLGAASGVKNFFDLLGLVLAALGMGRLIAPDITSAVLPVAVIAAVLAISAAVTLLGVRETPSTAPIQAAQPLTSAKQAQYLNRSALQGPAARPYLWLITSRFAFLLGLYLIQSFAQYYVRDVLHTENPVKLIGNLLATITLGMLVFALLGGRLGDRRGIGHKQILYMAGGIAALGYLLLMQARTPLSLLAFGGLLGVGLGLFLTSNWALASQLAPAGSAGKYLGLTNLATAGAAATARLGGPLIDLGNNAAPGAFWGYTGMFLFGALCAMASVWLLRGVKEISEPIVKNTSR